MHWRESANNINQSPRETAGCVLATLPLSPPTRQDLMIIFVVCQRPVVSPETVSFLREADKGVNWKYSLASLACRTERGARIMGLVGTGASLPHTPLLWTDPVRAAGAKDGAPDDIHSHHPKHISLDTQSGLQVPPNQVPAGSGPFLPQSNESSTRRPRVWS